MKRMWLAGLVLAMGSGLAFAAGGETLPTVNEIVAKIKAKMAEVKSFEADMKSTMDFGEGKGSTTTGHVVAERMVKDGEKSERCAMEGTMAIKAGEGKAVTAETKMVYDGTYVWVETRSAERAGIRVTKRNLAKGDFDIFAGDMKVLELSEKVANPKVGEETIQGQKMYVVEWEWPQSDHDAAVSKTKVWIEEDNLFIRRRVDSHDDGKDKSLSTTEITNLKVDQNIDPKVFEYTPPEGAKVEDKTKPADK